ncbi:GTP-dependent dephospho-CoA kinase family protein [Methanimicrococcus blatticola]|uniref:GTP-dependent dephospho-CoA kinase n=1 Tax=Methanimicrococcus blatticola TaxID=91560 RepID=A0A484F602_9EURY|nr:DUF359 domain-containing protein [Methanimicrococcus blatticola]MBZ3935137.1 DUF359 domain-containing protein [Methanimicrococcus blatticola]MCC2508766.1 DUF359 domain-containing protein [Methanimicrococcus blatticola]TDQ71200.1 hypothetical protein C7391_0304 [Methanimicrococcus blatticola]
MELFFDLPVELRPRLKKPYGALYPGDHPSVVDQIKAHLDESFVIAVGDVTTYNLFKAGVRPRLCLIDQYTKRTAVSKAISAVTSRTDYVNIYVKNPAGMLSSEMVLAIKEALASDEKHICICVDGEEDLATLPVIALADVGSLVLYGQPDEGLVCVKVTEDKKEEMNGMLKIIFTEKNTKSIKTDDPVCKELRTTLSAELKEFLADVF